MPPCATIAGCGSRGAMALLLVAHFGRRDRPGRRRCTRRRPPLYNTAAVRRRDHRGRRAARSSAEHEQRRSDRRTGVSRTFRAQQLTRATSRARASACAGSNPQRFGALERIEFIVGLGEALYFEEAPGAAANVFESVLVDGDPLPADARDRVLDWWATAMDAWPPAVRPGRQRHLPTDARSHARRARDATRRASPAAYWLAAAARAQGDLQGPGTRRKPDGCARPSRPTTARRCAAISIG